MQSARGFEYGVRHILSPQSGSVVLLLAELLDLQPKDVEFLIDLGSVYVNHKRIQDNSHVSVGDYLRVHTKPRRFPTPHENFLDRVLFSNDHFVVVNKPAGLPVHASVDNRKENLLAYLQEHLTCPLFVTHRLDVPTRGLIVFAKTELFQTEFNKLLIQREILKLYRAQVEGQGVSTGLQIHYMEPSPRAPKKVGAFEVAGWQECRLEILDVKNISSLHGTAPQSEILIRLLTGRTHQIRAQLGFLGHPVVGDHAYGAKKNYAEERIELEACELKFKNPLTDEEHHFSLT